MDFDAEIIKEANFDPCIKIAFSYKTDEVVINSGYAEVMRKGTRSVITYGPNTSAKLNKVNKSKLELELLNKVFEYLLINKDSL